MDITHLTLYNLVMEHHKKYYELDEEIMPYLNSIWLALQLPSEVSELGFLLACRPSVDGIENGVRKVAKKSARHKHSADYALSFSFIII